MSVLWWYSDQLKGVFFFPSSTWAWEQPLKIGWLYWPGGGIYFILQLTLLSLCCNVHEHFDLRVLLCCLSSPCFQIPDVAIYLLLKHFKHHLNSLQKFTDESRKTLLDHSWWDTQVLYSLLYYIYTLVKTLESKVKSLIFMYCYKFFSD